MGAGARLVLHSALLVAMLVGFGPGCVDDRVLHGAESGGRNDRGGASSAGAGAGAGAGRGGAGGAQPQTSGGGPDNMAGSAGEGPDSGTECPDLDGNDVLDCEETLIKNPSFDLDSANWTAETDTVLGWDETDARSRPDSGSLVVQNAQAGDGSTLGMVGASQCVTVMPGERYGLYAESFIEAEAPGGYTGATAWFYDRSNCSGEFVNAASSPLQGAINTWRVIRLRPIVVPDLARSMLVRIAVAKELSAEPLTVRFDNILLSR